MDGVRQRDAIPLPVGHELRVDVESAVGVEGVAELTPDG
jgi:hypothetical protein